MAQPAPYNRQNSFTLLAAESPSDPYTGADLDEEFNAIKVTLDEALTNLALIQRDDGDLANGSVGNDQLSSTVNLGLDPPTAWVTAHAYIVDQAVFNGALLYRCLVAHTSGTFATDLAAAKWLLVADFTAAALAPGAIGTTELANLAVTTAKLALLAVTPAQLATNAVTTSKITDANITTPKIADANVTLAKLASIATASFVGRNTAGTGVPEVLSATVSTAILNALVGDSGSGGTKGLVPAPSAGDAALGKRLTPAATWTYPWVLPPQGRLTPTTGVPAISTGVTAGPNVYYTPYVGNLVPIYDGTGFGLYTFAELTLALNATPHVSLGLYDVFVFLNSGVVTIGTGPIWTAGAVPGVIGSYVSAGSLTTGTAARGTGAASTEIQRVAGLWTNTNVMDLKNGSTTYSAIAAGKATYLGTIWIDATAAQISCLTAYGQNRKYGVWNAYNRVPIVLQAGDSGSAWAAYNTNTIRAANGTAANGLTVLCGLPEENVLASYSALVTAGASARTPTIGVGYNSTTAISGRKSAIIVAANLAADQLASYEPPPFIGLGAFISLQSGDGSATTVWTNGSAADELRAVWRG